MVTHWKMTRSSGLKVRLIEIGPGARMWPKDIKFFFYQKFDRLDWFNSDDLSQLSACLSALWPMDSKRTWPSKVLEKFPFQNERSKFSALLRGLRAIANNSFFGSKIFWMQRKRKQSYQLKSKFRSCVSDWRELNVINLIGSTNQRHDIRPDGYPKDWQQIKASEAR